MNADAMKQAFSEAKRNERHHTAEESRYWCDQYKQLAKRFIDMAEKQDAGEETVAGLHATIGHLIALVDHQYLLLQEVNEVCGRDGHGGELEDGESDLIDRVRQHLNAIVAPPKREPLTDERIKAALWEAYKADLEAQGIDTQGMDFNQWYSPSHLFYAKAAIKAAHGIKGEAC